MTRLSLTLAAATIVAATSTLDAQTYRTEDARRTGVGVAVAVSEGSVAIGWPHWVAFTPMMPPGIPGNVLMYSKGDGGRWVEDARVAAADGTDDNRFGRALALHGDRMVVGATIQGGVGGAYIFERDASGAWREISPLVPSGMETPQSFGRAAALAGDFAFVSTVAYENSAGVVLGFKKRWWDVDASLDAAGVGRRLQRILRAGHGRGRRLARGRRVAEEPERRRRLHLRL